VLGELLSEEMSFAPNVSAIFMNRIPSYALLVRADAPVRIAFRHEFYFALFLGARISRLLKEGEDISDFISRSTISPVLADEIASHVSSAAAPNTPRILETISRAKISPTAADTSRANIGVMVWGLIRELQTKLNGTIGNAIFNAADFSNTRLKNVAFIDCIFTQCNLVDATWLDIVFEKSLFTDLKVTEMTKLAGKGLAMRGGVIGLEFQLPNGQTRKFYEQGEVATILEKLGIQFKEKLPKKRVISDKARGLIDELQIFLKVPARTLYFSEADFQNRGISVKGELR